MVGLTVMLAMPRRIKTQVIGWKVLRPPVPSKVIFPKSEGV